MRWPAGLPRETLSNNPTPISETSIDEPPKLMNGNATPVKGINPVITAMLINA